MRLALLCLCLLLPAASGAAEPSLKPFPLPAVDGKALAVQKGQKSFRVPWRFAKVEAFFREQFKAHPKIAIKTGGSDGARTLTLTSKRADDAWAKAVVKEGEVDTTVELTPVLRFEEEQVGGRMPLVIFIPRSADAAKAADSIEHLERTR